jgi:hypothetical protein
MTVSSPRYVPKNRRTGAISSVYHDISHIETLLFREIRINRVSRRIFSCSAQYMIHTLERKTET